MFILLLPMAYYVQEMTVRLGAVTKRGHAEAIFEGFGPFWGWFSLTELAIVNWLTLITEYIGWDEVLKGFYRPHIIGGMTGARFQPASLLCSSSSPQRRSSTIISRK